MTALKNIPFKRKIGPVGHDAQTESLPKLRRLSKFGRLRSFLHRSHRHGSIFTVISALPTYEKEWIPSAKHGTSGSTHRNVEPRGYEDIFKTWDEQCVSPLPLLHPGTGQPLTASDTPCPTFRPPRPRTPQAQRPSLPRSTTLPLRPVSVMQASPLTPSRYSAYGIIPSEASHFSPTRPSSNRSASSLAKSADASRSSSVASSRARSDPLPVQPGPHNSIAEMRARQVNTTHVQQPVGPYTGLCSPLNAAKHAVSGRLKKRSNTLDMGVSVQGEE